MPNANKNKPDEEKERERIATVKENNLQKLRDLGINPNKYGFDKFKVSYDWQRQMVVKVKDFFKKTLKSQLYLQGKVVWQNTYI